MLRPGGVLLLADHVAAAPWPVRGVQRLVELVTIPLGGEHVTRRRRQPARPGNREPAAVQRIADEERPAHQQDQTTTRHNPEVGIIGRFRDHGMRFQAHADALWEEVATVLAPLGLRLSESKTRVCHVDEGFDFLGVPHPAAPPTR